MYIYKVNIRVRYSETDRMGYCYYGNYAQFFEVARVEALRNLGFTYKKMEDDGVLLPVVDFKIKYSPQFVVNSPSVSRSARKGRGFTTSRVIT